MVDGKESWKCEQKGGELRQTDSIDNMMAEESIQPFMELSSLPGNLDETRRQHE